MLETITIIKTCLCLVSKIEYIKINKIWSVNQGNKQCHIKVWIIDYQCIIHLLWFSEYLIYWCIVDDPVENWWFKSFNFRNEKYVITMFSEVQRIYDTAILAKCIKYLNIFWFSVTMPNNSVPVYFLLIKYTTVIITAPVYKLSFMWALLILFRYYIISSLGAPIKVDP